FPGLRGRAAGGHPGSPRPSPVRGKTTTDRPCHYGEQICYVADGAGKCPGMRMDNAPARRVGAALARLLKRRISKGRAKGTDGTNVPVWGKMWQIGIKKSGGNGEARNERSE
ncbi:MAG: hypothetical protein LBQ30_08610, partial [Treponema sp.]|nr:hypothetical protein [Treponema sp.]